jgi:hypothetical protein
MNPRSSNTNRKNNTTNRSIENNNIRIQKKLNRSLQESELKQLRTGLQTHSAELDNEIENTRRKLNLNMSNDYDRNLSIIDRSQTNKNNNESNNNNSSNVLPNEVNEKKYLTSLLKTIKQGKTH